MSGCFLKYLDYSKYIESSKYIKDIEEYDGETVFAFTNTNNSIFSNNYVDTEGITFGGITYRCVNAAFYAQLVEHPKRYLFCNLSGNVASKVAEEIIMDKNRGLLDKWYDPTHKNFVGHLMFEILKVKFENPNYCQKLLRTGNKLIIQHSLKVSKNGDIWGDNCDGSGGNLVGVLLMIVREFYGGCGITMPNYEYVKIIKSNKIPSMCAECNINPSYSKHHKYSWCKSCFDNYGTIQKPIMCKLCFGRPDTKYGLCASCFYENACKYCKMQPAKYGSYSNRCQSCISMHSIN